MITQYLDLDLYRNVSYRAQKKHAIIVAINKLGRVQL